MTAVCDALNVALDLFAINSCLAYCKKAYGNSCCVTAKLLLCLQKRFLSQSSSYAVLVLLAVFPILSLCPTYFECCAGFACCVSRTFLVPNLF